MTIDGRLAGLTPFATQRLGWGPHRVIVEKEGFIAWAKDVQVERNQAATEVVTLVPSPEFAERYRSHNRGYRIGAWITTVVAAAAGAAALGVQFGLADKRYGEFEPLQHAFSDKPETLSSACHDAGVDVSQVDYAGVCYSKATDLADQGRTAQWVARGLGAAAVVSAGLATFFWVAGDDPSRYDSYRELGAAPAALPVKASLVPVPGGAMATVSLTFGGP